MLLAVLVTAVSRSAESLSAWLAALVVLAASSLLGGRFAGSVRRAESAQIVSSALLAFAGLPVELVAGARLDAALFTSLAWAAIFVPSALIVRAAFARAGRRHRRAYYLEISSVGLCLAAATAFSAIGRFPEALATGMAAVICVALACIQPSVKHMKPVGLTFAGLSAVSAVLLVF